MSYRPRNFTVTPNHRRILKVLKFVGKPMTLKDVVISVYTPQLTTLTILEDLVAVGLARRCGSNSYAWRDPEGP